MNDVLKKLAQAIDNAEACEITGAGDRENAEKKKKREEQIVKAMKDAEASLTKMVKNSLEDKAMNVRLCPMA